ncbi:hypothetical protein [Ruania alba]|uniref:Uncharacterized protein n=1 Tax=Ruania alba TaxID=648782 RepID=A0A1H5MDH4_9MICO|nr:hypothetical protein [Ruania alba]SEE87345.1 hypothetical protein SAMN04488554_3310 [Ruania alba]
MTTSTVQRRHGAAATAAAVLVMTLTGCGLLDSSGPALPTESCPPAGSPSEGAPGAADPLVTVAVGQGPQDLTHVLYEDGWVLSLAEATPEALAAVRLPRYVPSPYDDGPMAWQIGYLGECAMEQVTDLAESVVTENARFGDPMITDQPTTYVTRYGSGEPVRVQAYALGREADASGLDRGEQDAREGLIALRDIAADAVPTGEVLEVTTLSVRGDPEYNLPSGWPGPPLKEILGSEPCGELVGDDAQAVYDYLLGEPDDLGWTKVAVVPPGIPAC